MYPWVFHMISAMQTIAADNERLVAAGRLAPAQHLTLAPPPFPPRVASTSIAVTACDTVTAALALHRRASAAAAPTPPPPVAILNFANAYRAGGGYLDGAGAQEEDLCRLLPALHPALAALRYPLDHLVPPPCTRAFACRTPLTYRFLSTAVEMVVVTAATPDGRQGVDVASSAYMSDMRGRIRRVLLAAYGAGCRSVVLGAWGCGVFMNDPAVIARLFCEVLTTAEWRGRFDDIVFAILEPRGTSVRALAFRNGLDPLTR